MSQISFFDGSKPFKITNPIRLIELFAGIGSQAKALTNLGANFEHYRVCEFKELDGTIERAIEETTLAGYLNENGREFYLCHSTEYGGCDVEPGELFLTREEAQQALEGVD